MFNPVEFFSMMRFLILRKTEISQIIFQIQQANVKNTPHKVTIYNLIWKFSQVVNMFLTVLKVGGLKFD